MTARILIFFFIILWCTTGYAHGDLHKRIKEATKEIKNYPDSAYLYLKRGLLYHQHEEHSKALLDFNKCQNLGYLDIRLFYNLAKVNLDLGSFKVAEEWCHKILSQSTQHVKTYRLLGQIYYAQTNYVEAGHAFNSVIEFADKKLPENYLEASIAFEKSNTPEGRCATYEIIEDGIASIGLLRTFLDRLIDLSVSDADWEKAIVYQTKIIDQAQRKERGYYERALLHKSAGRYVAANNDLKKAQLSIQELNSRQQSIKSTKDLAQKITQELNYLESLN